MIARAESWGAPEPVPEPGGTPVGHGPRTGDEIIRGPLHTARRRLPLLIEHPVAFVVVVALLSRLVLAIGSAIFTDGYLIPDEGQYVAMATAFARGIPLDVWYPGYGQSLYDSTLAFSAPLSFMFDILGPSRLIGSIFSAVAGAATAGLTTAIAARFLKPTFAILAGLVVALSPSQILFSSVVLREAHTWLALALVGLGAVLLTRGDWRRLAGGLVLVAAGLLALAYLRPQTLLAASWAVALAMVFTPWRGWAPRMASVLVVAALIPWAVGFGVGGLKLATGWGGHLSDTRAKLAVGANSAFDKGRPPPPPGQGDLKLPPPASEGESITSGFAHLPEGIVNVTMRPYPWEPTPTMSLFMARVENLEWYLLYVLCAIGIVVSLRRLAARLALQFPILLLGMMIGIAAVTQGNLGTAFRHRDQVLWALAIGAAAGAQWLWMRWAARRGGAPVEAAAESSREPVATRA